MTPAITNKVGATTESPVGTSRPGYRGAVLRQDRPGGLPGAWHEPQQRAVAGPGVPIERPESGHHLGPERDSDGCSGPTPKDRAPPPPRWTCTGSGRDGPPAYGAD